MEFARDIYSGALVVASSAVSGKLYTCPVCRGAVRLRSGKHYAPHFAHLHKSAKPECELYHPGHDSHGVSIGPARSEQLDGHAGAQYLNQARPQLMLSVSRQRTRHNVMRWSWSLALVLPQLAQPAQGYLDVSVGLMAERKVALSELVSGRKALSISPEANYYGVKWFSLEVPFAVRQLLQDPVEGLLKNRVAVFSYSRASLHSRIEDRLQWGHAYFFVYHADQEPEVLAEIEQLDPERLPPLLDWRCFLVTLPLEPEPGLAAGLCRLTNLSEVALSVRGSVLWPVSLARQHGSSLVGASIQDLWVAVWKKVDGNASEAGTLSISLDQDQVHPTLLPVVTGTEVFRLSDLGKSSSVDLSIDETNIWDIHRSEFSDARVPLVNFCFRQEGDTIKRVAFHSTDCASFLRAVREQAAEVVAIEIPEGIVGTLEYVIPSGTLNRDSIDTTTGISRKSVPLGASAELDIAKINRLLRKEDVDVYFSFNVLGVVHVPRRSRSQHESSDLPEFIRSQMIWICNAVATGAFLPPDAPDSRLLSCFHSIDDPGPYLPQYDAILDWLNHKRVYV